MKTQEEYLQDPTACPFCGSTSIDGADVTVDGGSANQHVECMDCRREWRDVYSLIEFEPIEEDEEGE